MKSVLRIFALVAVGIGISACSPKQNDHGTSEMFSAGAILKANLSPAQKAEELALGAEKILAASGYVEALQISELALKEDPQNFRAAFIRVISRPAALQKGLLVRVFPLAEQDPGALKNLTEKFVEIAKNEGSEGTKKNFFMDGVPDIKTEKDFQAHVDITLQAWNDVRIFMKKSKGREFSFRVPDFARLEMIRRHVNSCMVIQKEKMEFEMVCPTSKSHDTIALNQADFESFQDMAAFIQINLSINNSYDLSGLIKMGIKQETLTSQQMLDELLKNEEFGKLRDPRLLRVIKELGIDVVGGLSWMLQNQASLCPNGQEQDGSRPGMYFQQGICIYSGLSAYLPAMQATVSGELVESISNREEETYKTRANYMALFENPVSIRALSPIKLDACGSIESTGDATLAGIFPAGDANVVLPIAKAGCRR